MAAATDLVGNLPNPPMVSWNQAGTASELEREVTAAPARLCHPPAATPDAVLTTIGGTESNLAGLLRARSHPDRLRAARAPQRRARPASG